MPWRALSSTSFYGNSIPLRGIDVGSQEFQDAMHFRVLYFPFIGSIISTVPIMPPLFLLAFGSFHKLIKELKVLTWPIQSHTKYLEIKSRFFFCFLSQASLHVKCGFILWYHIYHHHKTFWVPAGCTASYQTPWDLCGSQKAWLLHMHFQSKIIPSVWPLECNT